jgi:ACS family allantoate permease-like MFS transporter
MTTDHKEKSAIPCDIVMTQESQVTDDATGDIKEIHAVDLAYEILEAEAVQFTPEEEAIVLSKIDWHILPLLCWVYMVQFADKTTLNYASLMGIRTDTHLNPDSQQYSWVSSIFYAGYIAWQSEYALLIDRVLY